MKVYTCTYVNTWSAFALTMGAYVIEELHAPIYSTHTMCLEGFQMASANCSLTGIMRCCRLVDIVLHSVCCRVR